MPQREGVQEDDWVKLRIRHRQGCSPGVYSKKSMKEGHIRVPHGWWYPESRGQQSLAGAFISSDAVLCSDEDEHIDHEQGVPHFKGLSGPYCENDATRCDRTSRGAHPA